MGKSKWESDEDDEDTKKHQKKSKQKKQRVENKAGDLKDEKPSTSVMGPTKEDLASTLDDEDEDAVIGEYPGGWKITKHTSTSFDEYKSGIGIMNLSHTDEGPSFTINDIKNAEKEFAKIYNVDKPICPCQSVDTYKKLNRIDEGTFGVVYKAQNMENGEICALKRLKIEQENAGFSISSLREIAILLNHIKHPHVVNVREVVVGNDLNQVFMVMDYAEHDLKALMDRMDRPFLQAEVKSIMMQVLSAVNYLHENWFIHRDLKTSNILINAKGEVKIADFGLTRKFGQPAVPMTPLVVTLWYRAPELLLGEHAYTCSVDMWSLGCIYGELVKHEPIIPGRSEIDQLNRMFKLLGTPTKETWPGMEKLPNVKDFSFPDNPHCFLQSEFGALLTNTGIRLLSGLLTFDPSKRLTADEALNHELFTERPYPAHPSLFEKWLTDEEMMNRERSSFPSNDLETLYKQKTSKGSVGFQLKF